MKLKNRRELVSLFEEKGYKTGIEVGVRDGLYSKFILENSSVTKLFLVDPWEVNKELAKPEEALKNCLENLKGQEDRYKLIKAYSPIVARLFKNDTYDFIYIDALHDYKSVSEDIKAWYPKVKSGGILAGHDYDEEEWPDVFRAVNEFVKKKKYELHLTGIDSPDREKENDGFRQSWFIIKK